MQTNRQYTEIWTLEILLDLPPLNIHTVILDYKYKNCRLMREGQEYQIIFIFIVCYSVSVSNQDSFFCWVIQVFTGIIQLFSLNIRRYCAFNHRVKIVHGEMVFWGMVDAYFPHFCLASFNYESLMALRTLFQSWELSNCPH